MTDTALPCDDPTGANSSGAADASSDSTGFTTPVRLGRHHAVGAILGILGALLAFAIAPNLIAQQRTIGFEPPPDPLSYTFFPQAFVRTIGVAWLVVGAASLLPRQFARAISIAQGLAAALTLPLLVGLGLALSTSKITNVTNLVDESFLLATPLALGAMTGLWCERSGIVNIGIEGQMLASAGLGYLSYALLGDAAGGIWLWVGIGVAVLTGGLMAVLHAVLSIRFQINQIVAGVVVNLFALGLTGFLRSQVIVPDGHADGQSTSAIALPLLSHIPIVGTTFFTGGPIHFAMFIIVFLTWLVLYRTPWGLRVRACGEHPHAAETVGVRVRAMRYQAVIVGGLIAGLAGAWFSMESQGGFEDNMTNFQGFVALAALIVGKWTPWGAFAGALLFGFSRALGSRLQILKVHIGDFDLPSEFFQSLPYLVTLVVVAGALGRSVAPAAEGQPYSPSK